MPDDVSDRERVEKALRRSEERFELFMRHLPGAAFIKETQAAPPQARTYIYVNNRLEGNSLETINAMLEESACLGERN